MVLDGLWLAVFMGVGRRKGASEKCVPDVAMKTRKPKIGGRYVAWMRGAFESVTVAPVLKRPSPRPRPAQWTRHGPTEAQRRPIPRRNPRRFDSSIQLKL